MADSFFFYDLETSGLSPKDARIMQFAGQRTDAALQPVGEPVNVLIRLPPDVLPDPQAVLLTGITPQATLQDGLTEAEFLKFFYQEVAKPNTTFLGYNTVRFDDEFMRYLHWRNFYDPYRWQWADGCSRWDILDVVRMTRALRPEGISWPVTADGKPTNRLELLTVANKLNHDHAHDALSDVYATIGLAQLIQKTQPDLWKYLYDHRGKKQVAEVVEAGQPFVYTSGRYGSDHLHTTIATLLEHSAKESALVYDLRYDPEPFLKMTPAQLADAWRYQKDRPADSPRLPVKTMKYNRCPAVAPLGVLKDPALQASLSLSIEQAQRYLKILQAQPQFTAAVLQATQLMDREREAQAPTSNAGVDGQLYDGFISPSDAPVMQSLRSADAATLGDFQTRFKDRRLQQLVPLYKARNYPQALSAEERQAWDEHVHAVLFGGGQTRSRAARYFAALQMLAQDKLNADQSFILEELQLYGESIMPSDATPDQAAV